MPWTRLNAFSGAFVFFVSVSNYLMTENPVFPLESMDKSNFMLYDYGIKILSFHNILKR